MCKKPNLSSSDNPGLSSVNSVVEKGRIKVSEEDILLKNVKHSLKQHLPEANSLNLDPEVDRGCMTSLQRKLFTVANTYADLMFTELNHEIGEEVRFVYCLHALNHALKSKSRVVKHNRILQKKKEKEREAAIARRKARRKAKSEVNRNGDEDEEDVEFRDQGFARPKILILVPFRNAALRFVCLKGPQVIKTC